MPPAFPRRSLHVLVGSTCTRSPPSPVAVRACPVLPQGHRRSLQVLVGSTCTRSPPGPVAVPGAQRLRGLACVVATKAPRSRRLQSRPRFLGRRHCVPLQTNESPHPPPAARQARLCNTSLRPRLLGTHVCSVGDRRAERTNDKRPPRRFEEGRAVLEPAAVGFEPAYLRHAMSVITVRESRPKKANAMTGTPLRGMRESMSQ